MVCTEGAKGLFSEAQDESSGVRRRALRRLRSGPQRWGLVSGTPGPAAGAVRSRQHKASLSPWSDGP